jgi:hypothetical protein
VNLGAVVFLALRKILAEPLAAELSGGIRNG